MGVENDSSESEDEGESEDGDEKTGEGWESMEED